MRISILGWYDNHNVGDEAYKIAFPLLLPGHSLNFGDNFDPRYTDALIVGGGDVLHHSYLNKAYDFQGPKIALSVTATTDSSFEFMQDFQHTYVRDQTSFEIAKANLPAGRVSLLPDATFLLQPDPERGKRIIAHKHALNGGELRSKVVVVVVNSYLLHNGPGVLARDYSSFQYFSADFASIMDETNASFVFVPFGTKSPADDRVANAWVASRAKFHKKNIVFYDRIGVQDTLDVISAGDVVVSSRLHSTVFSTISGIPFVDVTHHDKNRGFVKTIGKAEWIVDYWGFNPERCSQLINKHIDRLSLVDYDLESYTRMAREDLRNASIL